ncbi:MAG: DNA replication/repair protein RecF [Clostridia bacterium]|nr:DNA replication/repair protein RecF [Clostridia bacterium]
MKIEKVKLFNYRNFLSEEVLLNPEVNVFRGENAQGKTNFLESIYLFSAAKSYRAANEKDLIKFGCEDFKIEMDFLTGDMPVHGEYKFSENEKREVKFNGIKASKNSLLSEHFKTVLFSPEEIDVIKGEKELRRNLIDDAICNLKPNYAKILKDYNKCLKQKNILLKKRELKNFDSMLDIWNLRLSEYGSRLMMYRGSFARLLSEYAKVHMDELTDGKENLLINYIPFIEAENTDNIEENKKLFNESMEKYRRAEIERGQSLTGPQRDDIEFLINGNNVKLFGSQGQQRSCILCVKLAMTEIIKDRCGFYPVLLLDDILSELDKKRQSYMIEKIKGKQTIITCTGVSGLRRSKRVTFFTVKDGKITKEQ